MSETTAKGTGLGRAAGKEDPVELDSNLDVQSYHRDNWLVAAKRSERRCFFDPSMSALPSIENEILAVLSYIKAKPQPRERAWDDQRGKNTLLRLTLTWMCGTSWRM